MVKNKGNEGNQIEDVNVMFQRREETQRNNFIKKFAKHENQQEQKGAQQASHRNVCS